MPQPTARELHVDQLLTNISLAYKNQSYIADLIFPMVPVEKQSDKIASYDQSFWFRDQAHLRAPATKSQGGGFKVDTSAIYFADRYSFRFEIADPIRENADAPFNLDRDAAEFVTDKMQMKREVMWATDFFKTGVWGADRVGGVDFTQWSDYGGSTPLTDMTGFMDNIELRIAREANTAVMGKQVYNQLKWHPDLLETIKYTQRGQLTPELIASLMEVERLLVGRSILTTTPEGVAEASVTYSRIWGKNVLLLFVPPSPSLLTPAAGYTFVWRRVAGAIQYIKRMRDEEREVDIIEGNTNFDQKVTAARAGEFLSLAVA